MYSALEDGKQSTVCGAYYTDMWHGNYLLVASSFVTLSTAVAEKRGIGLRRQ